MSEAASGTYADGEERSRLQPRILVPALLVWAFLPGVVQALVYLFGFYTYPAFPMDEQPGAFDLFLGQTVRGWMFGLELGLLLLLPWMLLRPRPQPGMRAAEAVKFMLLALLVEVVWVFLKVAASGALLTLPYGELSAQMLTVEARVINLGTFATTWLTAFLLAHGGPPRLRADWRRPLVAAPWTALALWALAVAAAFFLAFGVLQMARFGWPSGPEMPQAASRFGLSWVTKVVAYVLAVLACGRIGPSQPGRVEWSRIRGLGAILLYAALLRPLLSWAYYQRQIEGPVEPYPLSSFWSLPGVLSHALEAGLLTIALFAVLLLPRTAARDRAAA